MDLTDKCILVTGAAGFLGRHVVAELNGRGCRTIIHPTRDRCDYTSEQQVRRTFALYKPNVVIHCAARVGGIKANSRAPGLFFYENALMGLHVIEACRLWDVRKLVVVGTVCSYPEITPTPFIEADLWKGYPEPTNAPYGVAKRALLTMCQAYREQYNLNAVFLMPANLYGPGDNYDRVGSHVIPAMIRKFVEAKDSGADVVELWGDGSPTREFLYVGDAARMIVDAAERYDSGLPMNLGTGAELSMLELAGTIAGMVGYRGRLMWGGEYNGQIRRRLDLTRARAFGFTARVDLFDGLATTINSYCAGVIKSSHASKADEMGERRPDSRAEHQGVCSDAAEPASAGS